MAITKWPSLWPLWQSTKMGEKSQYSLHLTEFSFYFLCLFIGHEVPKPNSLIQILQLTCLFCSRRVQLEGRLVDSPKMSPLIHVIPPKYEQSSLLKNNTFQVILKGRSSETADVHLIGRGSSMRGPACDSVSRRKGGRRRYESSLASFLIFSTVPHHTIT